MKRMKRIIACALAGAMALFALSACSNGPSEESCEKVCGTTWLADESQWGGAEGALCTWAFEENGMLSLITYAQYSPEEESIEKFIMEGTWSDEDGTITYHMPEMEVEGDLGGSLETDERFGEINVDENGIMSMTNENGNDLTLTKLTNEELEELLHPSLTAENADEKLAECDFVINDVWKWDSGSEHKNLYDDQIKVSLTNNSNQTARDITFAVCAWNENGDPVRIDSSDSYQLCSLYDEYLEPGATWNEENWGWDIDADYTYNVSTLKAIVTNVTFDDGTTWTNPLFDAWLEIYENKPLA